MEIVREMGPREGVVMTCAAVGLPRSSYYYKPKVPAVTKPSPRALPPEERKYVLDLMHEPRFVDLAPDEVWATLLDERKYVCSTRTMYRILAENKEVKERRAQRRHPFYKAPELLATKPNQVWSWDITKLKGPTT